MSDTKRSGEPSARAADVAPPAPKPAAPTLYQARVADPRDRAALPQERPRGRAALRAEVTSDVTRFRGILIATAIGAAAVAGTALAFPPPGGHASPGPLSRPHAKAKLECTSCHLPAESEAKSATGAEYAVPSSACERCHGAHGSLRKGHVKAAAAGLLQCSSCHAIHRSDQGVTFVPGKEEGQEPATIRWAPGVDVEVSSLPAKNGTEAIAFRPSHVTTVALPRIGSCTRCHDLDAARDPIQRCAIPGQESLGPSRPAVCFDEHQPSFPGPKDRLDRASGVCSGQHTQDRAAAWEAAREVAAAMPIVDREVTSGGPPLWLGAGAFAAALALAGARGTSALASWRKRKRARKPLEAMLKPATRVRLPTIDVSTCLGCYACVDACPYDVLDVERYVAVVTRPEACCGLTLCEQRCPNGSLKVTDGAPIGGRPRLRDDLESLDVPGLFLAGDVTGLPLIKNAIHQGAHAVTVIHGTLKRDDKRGAGVLDLLIVGAGPAGISAALRAKELGISYEVIEQANVAQSIQSFSRGKLVFDQPLELPTAGKLWLKESTKEDLLAHWLRIVRQEKLPIHPDTRMVSVDRAPSGELVVTTEPREGGPRTARKARRVLLAIGQRGTPRRLPFEIPADVEARVHYHLSDARSFAGKRVVVVGLGDVAMEAAIALGRQAGTEVTVVHRGDGFTRGSSRNVAEVKRMRDAGRISLVFQAEVSGLDPSAVRVRAKSGPTSLPWDAMLVLIGSIPPWATLRAAGVKTIAEAPSA